MLHGLEYWQSRLILPSSFTAIEMNDSKEITVVLVKEMQTLSFNFFDSMVLMKNKIVALK